MDKDDLLATLKEAGEQAVKEGLDEAKDELVALLKEQVLDQLTDKKEELVAKLTEEIANTKSIGVKARDYLYLIIVNIVDKFYQIVAAKLA